MIRAGRLVGGLMLVLATLGGVATSAWAYWSASGTGTGSATTATLNPPTEVTASATGTSVGITWAAPASGVTPLGYTVTRVAQTGGGAVPACGGAVVTGGGCTDSPVPDGTFTYAVTAVFASWSATSSPSNAVTVTSAPTDTTPPTVTGVSADKPDGSYPAGTTIPVTVRFSEPVTVTTGGGTPTLTLATGTPGTTAVSYTGGSGTDTLTFTYTVAAGNTSTDLNYSATTSLALNGGTIRDAAGNNATLDLPEVSGTNSLAGNRAIVIDTTAPTVTSITRVGATPTNATSLAWTVTFSEPVSGVTTNNFTLATSGTGGTGPTIASASPTGTAPTATWTVTATTSGTTGTNTGTIRLDLASAAGITDPASNPLATTSFQGQAYTYDTTAPTVTSVTRVGATPTNATSLAWTVTFSEPVSGATPSNFTLTTSGTGGTAPKVTTATATGAAPTATWTVTATTSGTTGSDTASIRLDLDKTLSTITDVATNPLATPFTTGQAYTYDTTAPTVTITGITGVGGSGKVRVTGSGELALPVTVYLCFSPTNPGTVPCGAGTSGVETFTIAPLAAPTWTSPNSTGRGTGFWFASATQTDAAGNLGTATFGP